MGTIKHVVAAAAALIVLAPASAVAQEQYIELLRSDLKTQKVAIVTEAMQLSDAEAESFWPVYREYQFELDKLADQRLALIRDYAENFEMMTDEKAKQLAEGSFAIQEERLNLWKRYYGEFEQAVGSINAAKFMQLDNAITMLVDLQIAASLPLIQAPAPAPNN